MEKPKPLTQQQGQQAENLACEFLQQQGLQLICRNFYCKGGELDLVMQHHDMLVFVEVRYRRQQNFGGAVASVTPRKQQKMTLAARYFLLTHPQFTSYGARFDVIAIDKHLNSPINWIPAAFLVN